MLKIDVIKFEAQDVITSSVAAAPVTCICIAACFTGEYGNHNGTNAEKCECQAEVHEDRWYNN